MRVNVSLWKDSTDLLVLSVARPYTKINTFTHSNFSFVLYMIVLKFCSLEVRKNTFRNNIYICGELRLC